MPTGCSPGLHAIHKCPQGFPSDLVCVKSVEPLPSSSFRMIPDVLGVQGTKTRIGAEIVVGCKKSCSGCFASLLRNPKPWTLTAAHTLLMCESLAPCLYLALKRGSRVALATRSRRHESCWAPYCTLKKPSLIDAPCAPPPTKPARGSNVPVSYKVLLDKKLEAHSIASRIITWK